MNNENNLLRQKRDLDEIGTCVKELSEREYERDTPDIVAALKQWLDRIWESIVWDGHYWKNLEQLLRVKSNLATLEPKLREAREAQRLEINKLRDDGLPV